MQYLHLQKIAAPANQKYVQLILGGLGWRAYQWTKARLAYMRSNLWSSLEKTSATAVELEIMHTARCTCEMAKTFCEALQYRMPTVRHACMHFHARVENDVMAGGSLCEQILGEERTLARSPPGTTVGGW